VVVERSAGELALAPSLVSRVEEVTDRLEGADDDERLDALRSACGPDDDPERLLAALDVTARRIARFLALRAESDLSTPDCLRSTLVVEQFQRSRPRSDGAPDGFLPVRGDQLPLVLTLTPRAVIYVWRDDCDPCDTMRDEFEAIFGRSGDDELGLYAVEGPEAPELLYERYEVVGAPTTLFVVDGEVDCRLTGAHYRSVIDSEIETLRDVSA
jgi:hypothetical protein